MSFVNTLVNGHEGGLRHEGMTPMPISPYAANKVSCEAYMQAYAAAFGMEKSFVCSGDDLCVFCRP